MKTLKQFLTVTFFAVFVLITSNINAQKIENVNEKQNNIPFFLQANLNTADELSVITTESRYFSQIDATITMTFNKENGKVFSLSESSNTLSNELLTDIKNKINAAASSCHCSWWDVWCQGMCALCEAGVIDCDYQ